MKIPSKQTLKKYGLSEKEWLNMAEEQNYICPICERPFDSEEKNLNLVIDHLHAPNFKKMKPEERKKYVRAILCNFCNFRLLKKGMTTQRAKNIFILLEKFDKKLNSYK